MAYLGVNVDHVATIRQARREEDPDPVIAARVSEEAGAHSIVAHLREDRRHIQDRDILVLRKTVRTIFNLEMSLNPAIVKMACAIAPDCVTIVPERRQEVTTEGGLDIIKNHRRIKRAQKLLDQRGVRLSVFIAPVKAQVKAAHDLGIKTIELHTGRYAQSFLRKQGEDELKRIDEMSQFALERGLSVSAGHGLNYHNVQPIARIKKIIELNIGHAIIARAVFVGLKNAVREMLELIV